MRSFLLLAAYLGSVAAQAGLSTITTTILSTTSSVVSTSTSSLTASSCATSTGTDGQPTATCKSSFIVQPVEVYSQVVLTITTQYVLTVGSSATPSTTPQTQTQTQAQTYTPQTTFSTTRAVAATSTYIHSTTSISSIESTTVSITGLASTTSSSILVSTPPTGSASTSSSSSSSQNQSSSAISSGTIAAIVVAVLLGLALLGVAALFHKRRQRKSRTGARGLPIIKLDAEKGMSMSVDRHAAALSKSGNCSETTSLTQEAPPTPSTPGFPDEAHERYEMNTPPPRAYGVDTRPSYSPFPRVPSRKQ